MAPALLEDKKIPRRTLGHDMESFFAVIVWIATLDYDDEAALQAKPLAMVMPDNEKAPEVIINAKGCWFELSKGFRKSIINYFDQPYQEDRRFLMCLFKLRKILYPGGKFDLEAFLSDESDEETGDADPMKEDLFRQCMKEIDDYLHETKGCSEMQLIDSNALAQHTLNGR
jgi:hypothetical protein